MFEYIGYIVSTLLMRNCSNSLKSDTLPSVTNDLMRIYDQVSKHQMIKLCEVVILIEGSKAERLLTQNPQPLPQHSA